MENKSLFHIQTEYAQFCEILEENGGELTPELAEALSINKSELSVKGTNYVKLIKRLESEVVLAEAYEAQAKLIKSRKNKVIEKLKDALLGAVNQYGEIQTELFKISTRKSESVEILDTEKIPTAFLNVKVTQTPDKTKIKEAIKGGLEVPGAELVENKNLSIR